MTRATNPANSALLAQSWEISVSEKVRGKEPNYDRRHCQYNSFPDGETGTGCNIGPKGLSPCLRKAPPYVTARGFLLGGRRHSGRLNAGSYQVHREAFEISGSRKNSIIAPTTLLRSNTAVQDRKRSTDALSS